MALIAGKRRAGKGLYQVPRKLNTHDTGPEHKHIHIVVFDALVRRIGVVTQACAYARQFVGRNRRTHTAPANQHTAVDILRLNRASDRFGKVGVVVALVVLVCSKINNLVIASSEFVRQFVLQFETGVVASNSYAHVNDDNPSVRVVDSH